jgi:hypothetical protein
MKRGKVSPCEDGSQKTARLLLRELCGAAEWTWQLPDQNLAGLPRRAVITVSEVMTAAATTVQPASTRRVKRALGVARIYFPL